MILKISLRAKGGVPKTLLEQKHRLNFLYFPQNTLMLTESREEFSDLHSIFRLRALRYSRSLSLTDETEERTPCEQSRCYLFFKRIFACSNKELCLQDGKRAFLLIKKYIVYFTGGLQLPERFKDPGGHVG